MAVSAGLAGVAAAIMGPINMISPLMWAHPIVIVLASVIFGLLVGIPALRMRGMYLGMVTLTFPIILTGLLFAFHFTRGEFGLASLCCDV
jgi:ABC-type branched-subunit amino acid transport system permease subunit